MTNYNVDYFIKKFEAIPENKWAVRSFIVRKKRTFRKPLVQCCAQGWCNINGSNVERIVIGDDTTNKEALALYALFPPLRNGLQWRLPIGEINNGEDMRYQQPTPKQRVLAALYDIKNMQQPPTESIEKTVYVSVPTSITEQTKELILS